MTDKIIQKHGNTRNFIVNLLLLGLTGAILINGANIAFYALMPNSYFIKYKSNTVTNVCITGTYNKTYAIQTTVEREIYPYLPDSIRKTRSIPASARVEIIRNNREVDRINTEFTYQWQEDNTTEIQNEANIILLPGSYSTRAHIHLDLPYRDRREAIVITSNTFRVPDDVPLCSDDNKE